MVVERPDDPMAATIHAALEAALRAPSAHNAQPWRLSPIGDDRYRLWYAYADKLLADPDDRDGIMAVGGFFETLSLAGESRAIGTDIEVPDASCASAGAETSSVIPSAATAVPRPRARSQRW